MSDLARAELDGLAKFIGAGADHRPSNDVLATFRGAMRAAAHQLLDDTHEFVTANQCRLAAVVSMWRDAPK